jgi:hypothetical protein
VVGLNCGLGPVKKYGWEYEVGQKDRRRNTDGPKWKKRNKNMEGFLGFWKLKFWFK